LLAVRQLLATRGAGGSEFVDAMATRGRRAVEGAATAAFDGQLEDAEDGIAVIRIASRAGAHPLAKILFGQLVTFAPNKAEVWAGLAEELALEGGTGASAKTTAALERA